MECKNFTETYNKIIRTQREKTSSFSCLHFLDITISMYTKTMFNKKNTKILKFYRDNFTNQTFIAVLLLVLQL